MRSGLPRSAMIPLPDRRSGSSGICKGILPAAIPELRRRLSKFVKANAKYQSAITVIKGSERTLVAGLNMPRRRSLEHIRTAVPVRGPATGTGDNHGMRGRRLAPLRFGVLPLWINRPAGDGATTLLALDHPGGGAR